MAIDWVEVRREFEQGVAGAGRLAERYGCREATVKRRAAKEGWKTEQGRRQGVEKEPESHPVLDDGSLWQGVRKRLVSGLHHNDAKLGLEELKVAKLAGEVLSSVIKGERLALGHTDTEDDSEDFAREMAYLTLPRGAGEADEGE